MSPTTASRSGNFSISTQHPSSSGKGFFPSAYIAALIAVLVASGSYSILPVWLYISRIWLNDPLRAIGAIFPLVALAGTLAAWRRIGWSMDGSLWGLLILALAILLARVTTSSIAVLRFHGHNESLLHPGPVIFLYGVGAVLLFGGTRLLRVSIAPLCLLLLVDPVPHSYNAIVDLPLQYLSANTARHFAHLIGLRPTGEQLRMMFAPDFGMQIVPGCNGVRGSITLAYLALIFGYIRHLRVRVLALTTLGAFLMGYALNLLRLCTLVIYYRIGISVPSIQPYGAGVDYAIGCTLFLFATLGVGLFVRWLEPATRHTDAVTGARKPANATSYFGYAAVARVICFLILALAFIVPTIRAGNSIHVKLPDEQALLGSFPLQVGSYHLSRTYAEHDPNGLIRLAMADYSTLPNSAGQSSVLTLGFYVGLDAHFVAYSRFAQGIRPDWTGALDATDASAQPPLRVHFVTTFYDDGIRREYDAESACYASECSTTIDSGARKFFFSTPPISDLVSASSGNRLQILLRQEWPDSDGASTTVQRAQFEANARQFIEQLNLRELVYEDGSQI